MGITGMQVYEVPVGSTAANFVHYEYDDDGKEENLSGGTSVLWSCRTPDGDAVTTDATGAYLTDGTDGALLYALTSAEVGTERDLFCDFTVTGLPSGTFISKMFILRVVPRGRA
jgi:hypothetical protein